MDSNSDLNVYWSAAEGEPPCCGADTPKAQDEVSSCCSQEVKDGSHTKQVSCHQSIMADEASRLTTQLGITDFNEWAGKIVTGFPDIYAH